MKQIKITTSITKRTPALEQYFKDISRFPMVTPEEEIELATRIKAGDQAAKDKLVNANLKFVVSIAKQYSAPNMELGDLISSGNIGLMHAADDFDPTKGFKFISYAVWWIRQSILQEIGKHGHIVYVPSNKIDAISKVNKAILAFEQEFQREPSVDELMDLVDLSERDIKDSLSVRKSAVSLETPITSDSEDSLLDVIPSEVDAPDTEVSDSFQEDLMRVLKQTLTEKEMDILVGYYGVGGELQTSEVLAEEYGCTKERIRQLRNQALEKVRSNPDAMRILKQYI